jgi:plasmid stability protein
MANLTITLDDDLLKKARIRAAELGVSVNAVLRDYLAAWAGATDRPRAVDSLLTRSKKARSGRGNRRWTRDELHER